MYAYIHTCMHANIQTNKQTDAHARLPMRTDEWRQASHTHTYTHTHTHTHTHMHTHIHTHNAYACTMVQARPYLEAHTAGFRECGWCPVPKMRPYLLERSCQIMLLQYICTYTHITNACIFEHMHTYMYTSIRVASPWPGLEKCGRRTPCGTFSGII